MSFLHRFYPYIRTYQKFIIGILIFISLCAAGFVNDGQGTRWFWTDYPFVGLLLIIFCIFLTLLLFDANRAHLIETQAQLNHLNSLFHDLSRRQQEVLRLIVQGKSNKEICQLLFIELSTLKTHINQIYKILSVNNRKDARRVGRLLLRATL